ncbi:uncharacterized protein TNCV_5075671 [Trichonephila clavipes]|uniref:Mutator-like transposase domain-containing protein n=1 Tax=Trichonephila clavipes TaxID=2585209 RepID=A0A8X6VCH6_TRICX|nr:uncharacterized protein TNCV_5075671 [Trichonephila clavipes]
MRCIGQGLSALSTFCTIISLPKPVSQKAYDSINIRIADEGETLANASMSDAALEEKILDGTRNCIAVSGDGTWKARGHTSLVGVCTLIGAECGKPYGDSIEIEKIECVGHVQKRMGSRLRKLKSSLGKKKLSDGKTVGKAASQMLSLTD